MNKNSYPHPYIAREGYPFIIFMLLASWGCFLFGHWSLNLICFIVTVFVIQFFRDPPRILPDDSDKSIVSPADGRVIVIEKTEDPYRNREALKISVFMNVFNVHSNRSPVTGVVQKVVYFAGSFLNASVDKASEKNERNAVLLKTTQGFEISVVQIAGLVARRILCYTQASDQLNRGQRYGFIRFGSRVDVYLPIDALPNVVIGEKVKATATILAYFPDNLPEQP